MRRFRLYAKHTEAGGPEQDLGSYDSLSTCLGVVEALCMESGQPTVPSFWEEQLGCMDAYAKDIVTGKVYYLDESSWVEEATKKYYRIYTRNIHNHKLIGPQDVKISYSGHDRKHQDPAGCRTLGWLVIGSDGSITVEGA